MGTRSGEDPPGAPGSGSPPGEPTALPSRIERLDAQLEVPMAVLGLVWLGVLIAELIGDVPGWLQAVSYVIWGVFVLEFVVRFAVAPNKVAFLRANWLTLVSIALPAARVFRALRALRAVQSLRVARVIAVFGNFKADLSSLMGRHGLKYVLALTLLVTFGGAGGMYGFEHGPGASGLHSYADALWWTAMLITTIGSQYWPRTAEGRILALLLSAYALGVLGYITAALSSFLIGHDANEVKRGSGGARSLDALRAEVAKLAQQVERLAESRVAPPDETEHGSRGAGERDH